MRRITSLQDLYTRAKDLIGALAIREDQLPSSLRRLLAVGAALVPFASPAHLLSQESPMLASKLVRPVGTGTTLASVLEDAGLSLAIINGMPPGVFAPEAWKESEDEVRVLVNLSAQRHVACAHLTSLTRLLAAELNISLEDIDTLAQVRSLRLFRAVVMAKFATIVFTHLIVIRQKVDAKKAVRVARNLDLFMPLVSNAHTLQSYDSAEGFSPLKGDAAGRSDNKTLETVLLGVTSSAEGFPTVSLHKVAADVLTTNVGLSIDSFTLWHLQVGS